MRPLPFLLLLLLLSCAPSLPPPPLPVPVPVPVPAPSPSPPLSLPAPAPAPAPSLSPPLSLPAPAPAPAPSLSPPSPAPSPSPSPLLTTLLSTSPRPALATALSSSSTHRFQVLYSPVRELPTPTLERHGHRVDAEYFFPASSLKLPLALATMDRLALLRRAHPTLSRDVPLRLLTDAPLVTSVTRDAWRALVVSDNASANRLLAVAGHRETHETLWALGLRSVRYRTGFATGADLDPVQVSPRIEIDGAAGAPADVLPARTSDLVLPKTDAPGLQIGKAVLDGGRLVEGPLSFAEKNAIRLVELQDALVRIVRPDLLPASSPKDAAAADDLAYLKKALGTLPSESGIAGFDRNVVADYQLVPFLRGLERVRPRGQLQIFSKIGQAYGFVVENAYVVEKATGRSFFLTAVVYANPNEVMNDDVYGYDSLAFPALADVAEVVARHAFTSAPGS